MYLIRWFVLLMSFPPALALAQADQLFLRVALPSGISFELPRNWIILSGNNRITLQASTEARLAAALQSWGGHLPFAANLYNDSGQTIGMVNVATYPDSAITQAELKGISANEIRDIDGEMEHTLGAAAESAGFHIISWGGTSIRDVGGLRAIMTMYQRSSSVGPFDVRMVRVFAGKRTFTLTVSHLDHMDLLLRPITDRIIKSLELH